MSIIGPNGKKIKQVDPEITFETLTNDVAKEIENSKWKEGYTLTEESTDKEISTKEDFRDIIETAKKENKDHVMLVLQPKYKLTVSDERSSEVNTFSIFYFGDSITTFDNVCKIISNECDPKNEKWQENCNLVYQDANGSKNGIKDEISFKAMIAQMKSTQNGSILLYLEGKVWCFFVFLFCIRLVFFGFLFRELSSLLMC